MNSRRILGFTMARAIRSAMAVLIIVSLFIVTRWPYPHLGSSLPLVYFMMMYATVGFLAPRLINTQVDLRLAVSSSVFLTIAGLLLSKRMTLNNLQFFWWLAVPLAVLLAWHGYELSRRARQKNGTLRERVVQSLLQMVPANSLYIFKTELMIILALVAPGKLARDHVAEASDQIFYHRSATESKVFQIACFALLTIGIAIFFVDVPDYKIIRWAVILGMIVAGLYCFAILRSFSILPCQLTSENLSLFLGVLRRQDISTDAIEMVEFFPNPTSRNDGDFQFAPLSKGNVVLHLRAPISIRDVFGEVKAKRRIYIQIDHPSDFVRLLSKFVQTDAGNIREQAL